MTRRPRRADQDSGAALILAIGFVVAVGTISGGLAGLATSGLTNRNAIEVMRDREYAADSAIEAAITQVRTTLITPAPCVASSDSAVSGTAIPIRVDWATTCELVDLQNDATGAKYPLRNVTFTACVNPTPTSVCASAAVIIRAVVNFEPAGGPVAKTLVQAWNVNR
jgi:hypothetical protein